MQQENQETTAAESNDPKVEDIAVVEEIVTKSMEEDQQDQSNIESSEDNDAVSDDDPLDQIDDPIAVFRMWALDERYARINAGRAAKVLEYEKRIRELKDERNQTNNQLQAQERQAKVDSDAQREMIETKYGINLKQYTYDDVTGVLTRAPEDPPDEGGRRRNKKKE